MTLAPLDPVVRSVEVTDHDVGAVVRFLVDHLAESGRAGTPHFALHRGVEPAELFSAFVTRWSRKLDEPLWGRAWALWSGPSVVGHLELRGGGMPSEMHRATLGMGVAHTHAGKGLGRRLLEVAIAWARAEPRLAWIDLGVFSENRPALSLYRKMGFVEQGAREDAYRVDGGVSVTDILMTLHVG